MHIWNRFKSKISNVNLLDAHFDYMSDAHVQKPTLIYFQTEPAVKLRPRSSTDSIRRSAVTFQTFFSRLKVFQKVSIRICMDLSNLF